MKTNSLIAILGIWASVAAIAFSPEPFLCVLVSIMAAIVTLIIVVSES